MLKEGKFGLSEAVTLTTVLITSKIFVDTPRRILQSGKTGAWLIPLISMAIALAGFLFIALFMKRFPGLTWVEAVNGAAGPVAGNAMNYLYLAFFFTLLSLTIRQFGETIILFALPYFPISVIIFFFLVTIIIAVLLGLEPIARSLFIASPFMLAAFFLVLLLLFPYYNIHNLFPLLGKPLDIAVGGLAGCSLYQEILFLALIMPVLQGWRFFIRAGITSIVLSGIIYMVFILIYLLVFPYEVGVELTSPYYSMARTVYLGRFFQRLESLFLVIWVIIGVGKLSLLFYACLSTAARIWKLKSYKPLVPCFTVFTFASAMLSPNMQVVSYLLQHIIFLFGGIPVFMAPLGLWLAALVFKRGKTKA